MTTTPRLAAPADTAGPDDTAGPADTAAAAAPAPDGSRTTERDLVLDVVRTGALGVVVLWHWVFHTVRWTDGGPRVGNPVAVTPGMWALTWFLQVMPAFFVIGGTLHSRGTVASTSTSTGTGTGTRTGTSSAASTALAFWSARLRRLLVPVLPLLGIAGAAAATALAVGRPDVARIVVLVISPLWFLVVYVVCVVATPAARWAHRRIGLAAVAVLAAAAVLVDVLRIGRGVGGNATGAAAFVCVWLAVHQLGFHFGRLRAASTRTQLAVTLGGFAAMALLVTVGPYPAAMVGVDGAKLSNLGPPTVMVVCLAVAQMGLLSLLAPAIARLGERHRPLLEVTSRWSMTVYAWHLLAYAIFWGLFAALLSIVNRPVDSRVDLVWWLQRPLWLMGPAILAIPLCRAVARFDQAGRVNPAAQFDHAARVDTSAPVQSSAR